MHNNEKLVNIYENMLIYEYGNDPRQQMQQMDNFRINTLKPLFQTLSNIIEWCNNTTREIKSQSSSDNTQQQKLFQISGLKTIIDNFLNQSFKRYYTNPANPRDKSLVQDELINILNKLNATNNPELQKSIEVIKKYNSIIYNAIFR